MNEFHFLSGTCHPEWGLAWVGFTFCLVSLPHRLEFEVETVTASPSISVCQ